MGEMTKKLYCWKTSMYFWLSISFLFTFFKIVFSVILLTVKESGLNFGDNPIYKKQNCPVGSVES